MKLKGTKASNQGSQTAWQCSACGAVIATTAKRGKPKGDCPSCLTGSAWEQQEIPIAVFDN